MITNTLKVHVDDLLITSTSADMIESLTERLKKRYGEMSKTNGTVLNYLGIVFDLSRAGDMGKSSKTNGTVLNYLGMVFDLSRAGEARVTMKGYKVCYCGKYVRPRSLR